jgi:uncharacterized membrane protein (Fun14 family)
MNRAERVYRADPRRRLLTHVAVMPGWHKAVLILALILTLGGIGGRSMARAGSDAHLQFSSSGEAKGKSHAQTSQLAAVSSLAGPATVLGISVLAGFVAGWYFRRFLMPMCLAVVVLLGGLWALAHFGMIHPETWTAAAASAKGAKSATAKDAAAGLSFTQYATMLKDLCLAHLPASGGGLFAACLGFRRW